MEHQKINRKEEYKKIASGKKDMKYFKYLNSETIMTNSEIYALELIHLGTRFTNSKDSSWVSYDDETKLFLTQYDNQFTTYLSRFINNNHFVLHKLVKQLVANDTDEFEIENLKKLSKTFKSSKYLTDIKTSIKGCLYDTDFDLKLNSANDLLPLKNGKIINLKTLEIRDRTHRDLFTFECPVSFVKETPHADKFFKDLMPKTEEREYLRKILGYQLTGDTSGRLFCIWYGNGSNGKGKVISVLKKILGKFYTEADKAVFCKQQNTSSGSASPHLFALLNKRCIGYSEGETSDNFELNESVCKQISGEDDISCRGLFKDQITFKSIGKLNFLTNHIPKLSGEKAVKDRLRLISFKQEFADNPKKGQKKRDPDFVNKIETIYLDEVFSWMVKGSKEYFKDMMINMPKSFEDETEEMLSKEDSITSFFKNIMVITKDNKDIIKR